jgi:DNA-binding protein YbaB
MFLMDDITKALEGEMQKRLEDREQRRRCVDAVMRWLMVEARKKPVPDLNERMELMRTRLEHMVENMEYRFEAGQWVVKVAGSDADTYRMFQFGTSWFEPDPEQVERLIFGAFADRTVVNAA